MPSFNDLQSLVRYFQNNSELHVIEAEVDPYLEIAEIHRRVIKDQGPALLFTNVKNSNYPVVTNLFGTKRRVDIAFGDYAKNFIKDVAKLPEELFPPSLKKLWSKKHLAAPFLRLGTKTFKNGELKEIPLDLEKLPMITSWIDDGGPFVTLPLVYTEHPESKIPNLGMYRMQRFSKSETGMHMQIAKGGGFHLAAARELNVDLPLNVFIGGPPAMILSAIAPLPENVPEVMLASLLLEKKLPLQSGSKLPLLKDAEFVITGSVNPHERKPEGPFGDHFGYYSLKHDFPVFRAKKLYAKKNAIYPATVVGKPRQEDFFIGDYLQEMLSPLFPLVMPAVKDLWSYGETGFHSLAAASVRERFKREAMTSAFRILGEGQLALTKFLLLIDKDIDLRDFKSVLEYVLERADFRTDLYVFSNLSMDTLDYTGPRLNEGSRGVMLGMGEKIRELPYEYTGVLPSYLRKIAVFTRGCLVVEGQSYKEDKNLAERVSREKAFSDWPLIIISDDAKFSSGRSEDFLWSTFTRFEPAADIHAKNSHIDRFHHILEAPIVIDARMKPWYPGTVETDEGTRKLVDERWGEYGI